MTHSLVIARTYGDASTEVDVFACIQMQLLQQKYALVVRGRVTIAIEGSSENSFDCKEAYQVDNT